MRWRIWVLVGALSMGVAVGCGNGDPVGNQGDDDAGHNGDAGPDSDASNQNGPNQQPQPGDDFAEGLDVWVGAQIGNEDNLTELGDGQSFGGRFANSGEHFFSIEVAAGQLIEVSMIAAESELEDELGDVTVSLTAPQGPGAGSMYFGDSIVRRMVPSVGTSRQFFAPRAGNYVLGVRAPGGEDEEYGFAFEISLEEVAADTDSFEFPGRTSSTLNDGAIDVYEVSPTETSSVALEVLAQQLPEPSELHPWVYVFDAAQGELVAQSNGQSQDLLDPQRDVALQGGGEYWVVIDMVEHVDGAAYEVVTDILATSEDNPKELSVAGEASFQGTIVERSGDYYSDYFRISVAPGEFKRLTLEADDELQPAMVVPESDPQTGFLTPYVVLPVEGVASVILGVDAGAGQTQVFDIEVSDLRNLEAHDDAPFGGTGFGYTATLVDADPATEEMGSGGQAQISLSNPGDLVEVRSLVQAGHLLWLDGGSQVILEPGSDASQLGFVPSWGLAGGSTLAGANLFSRDHSTGYFIGSGAEQGFWFRDAFFRGGAGYGSNVRLHQFDVGVSNTTALDAGNTTVGSAASIDAPVRITGAFTAEEMTDQQTHYFSLNLSPGDLVAVVTENEAGLETILTILDSTGDVLAEDRALMKQDGDDRAVAYEVDSGGQHILEVEQSCSATGCDTGQAEVVVVVD